RLWRAPRQRGRPDLRRWPNASLFPGDHLIPGEDAYTRHVLCARPVRQGLSVADSARGGGWVHPRHPHLEPSRYADALSLSARMAVRHDGAATALRPGRECLSLAVASAVR